MLQHGRNIGDFASSEWSLSTVYFSLNIFINLSCDFQFSIHFSIAIFIASFICGAKMPLRQSGCILPSISANSRILVVFQVLVGRLIMSILTTSLLCKKSENRSAEASVHSLTMAIKSSRGSGKSCHPDQYILV